MFLQAPWIRIASFRTLVARHIHPMQRRAARMLRNEHDAQEAVQHARLLESAPLEDINAVDSEAYSRRRRASARA